MNKLFLLISLLALTNRISGQHTTFNYDRLYADFKSMADQKKSYKIKSIKVVSYKRDNSKNGKITLIENYDTNGNIIGKKSHQFYRYKDYEMLTFSYDNLLRINKISHTDSYSPKRTRFEDIYYGENGQVELIISHYGKPNIESDTTKYFYSQNGKIKCKVSARYFTKDTLYYHYNEFGDVYGDSKSRDTLVYYKKRDANGCIIGYSDIDPKYTCTCDSLCNILTEYEETTINGIKYIITKNEYKYSGKNIIEKKFQHFKKNKLQLFTHIKYEYIDNGLLSKEISYNRKGKIIEVKKYYYELYK